MNLDYLNEYSSPRTVKNIRWSLKRFFMTLYNFDKFPSNVELEELVKRYFNEERDYETDLKSFFQEIKSKPPKSIRVLISCVKTFLIENDVELSLKFWKRLNRRIRGSRSVLVDKVPSSKELRKILMLMPKQGQALFSLMSSSGLRIGETLHLAS